MQPLLQVKNLSTHFPTQAGLVKAVDDVSFNINRGETIALLGESGCGKTVTALSIMRLVPKPGKVVNGEAWLDGVDLLAVNETDMREIRGARIAMVFQEPAMAFDPIYTVGTQIMETLTKHKGLRGKQALRKTVDLLDAVGIADADKRVHAYPHEFSGGMLQRAMIALAISCEPQVLIADEPTTSLDVSIQAQILDLLSDIAHDLETAVLLITHNFGVVSRYASRAYVMFAGKIVEAASVLALYEDPLHPYTAELWSTVLDVHEVERRRRTLPAGGSHGEEVPCREGQCVYLARCRYRELECEQDKIEGVAVNDSRSVLCRRVIGGRRDWGR